MTYKIVYVSTAEKELNKLPENDFLKIYRAINSLSHDPFPHGHIKLEGTKGNLYRIGKVIIGLFILFKKILLL